MGYEYQIKEFNVGQSMIECESSTFEESLGGGGRMYNLELTALCVHPDHDSQLSILGGGALPSPGFVILGLHAIRPV